MGGSAQYEHKPAGSQGRQAEPERLSLHGCARPRRLRHPYIDADCTEGSLLVPIYGHNMSNGGVFADFAKYSDEGYARSHSRIFLHTRDGGTYELSVIAVDVVDASAETVCPSFDDPGAIAEWIGKSDLVLLEYDGSSKVFAFATCSYQTTNSRTVVYAIQ